MRSLHPPDARYQYRLVAAEEEGAAVVRWLDLGLRPATFLLIWGRMASSLAVILHLARTQLESGPRELAAIENSDSDSNADDEQRIDGRKTDTRGHVFNIFFEIALFPKLRELVFLITEAKLKTQQKLLLL